MAGKIDVFRMFENQQAPRSQQIVFRNQFHNLFTALQVVGSIGKDHVELFGTAFQIEEDIGLDRIQVGDLQLSRRLSDEVVVYGVDLYGRHAPSAPRGELIADGSGSGEKVQYIAPIEIDQVGQYVEQIFFGEIGRWAGPQVARRMDRPSLVFSADYSHRTCLNRLPHNLAVA